VRRFYYYAAFLTFICVLSAQTTTKSIEWKKIKPEILDCYRALLQIDTTAGHETQAVDYLKTVIEAEGIPTQTFALDPNRANLVARIKGNGSKRPLLIFAHTDVVGVQREKWPVDPFGAVMKDGYIWGRGSKDDKPMLTANLIVFLMLKRLGVPLDRDVIFLAESGEEADTAGVGMNYMVREHMKEIDAEFAMTEGGGATIEGTRVTRVNIGSAEKLPARARLVATGTAGHGSVPRIDNALIHLGAAVEKVGRWETPMELNDTTRAYFEKLANISTPEKAARYKALLSGDTRAAQAYLREHEPSLYSMLRTSVVPTMLKAGVGLNVIPSEAEATLDIRAVPGENLDEFFTNMGKVINDPKVKIVPLPRMRPPSPAARLDTEMYRVMTNAAQSVYPGAVVLPSMSTGASDNSQLRAKGIQSYGVARPPLRTMHFAIPRTETWSV
jgi:acetylornithine deacetylase/succinyl-diaminopimelate desuccinylase-like protein